MLEIIEAALFGFLLTGSLFAIVYAATEEILNRVAARKLMKQLQKLPAVKLSSREKAKLKLDREIVKGFIKNE